jgi:molybdate transport system substrate-binding protein
MRFSIRIALLIAIRAGACVWFAQQDNAQDLDIHVLSSNGIKTAMEKLLPASERALGQRVAVQFDSSASIKRRLDDGEVVDVAILTPVLVDQLIADGKMVAGSRTDIASSGLGIAVREGVPKSDIRTPDALKHLLLSAKSIAYAKEGAGTVAIGRMLEQLGIAQDLKSKTIFTLVPGQSTESVANGQAEIALTLISEILLVRGAELLGPLPKQYQATIIMAAGIGGKSKNPDAAAALIRFLSGPLAAPVIKASGMETISGN